MYKYLVDNHYYILLWHVLCILVNIDQNQITTCKYYLARQEKSIDLYSLKRN